jgi:uncharacterized protein (TIGR03435 family)
VIIIITMVNGEMKCSGLLLLLTASALFAQNSSKPSFEVASIRPSLSTTGLVGVRFPPGGRMIATRTTLKTLILVAWSTDWLRVTGGPSWIESDAYDIEAKAEGDASQAERRIMLQSLLEDRFRLKLHPDKKELPVYSLIVTNPARLGSGLTLAREGDCVKIDPAKPLHEESIPFCGGFRTLQKMQEGQAIPAVVLQGHSVSLGGLARALASPLQREVVDETQLSGNFDVNLEYATSGVDTFQQTPGPTAPSIFTALQEQLGLKLESRKGSVQIYVVDHVEKPTEN